MRRQLKRLLLLGTAVAATALAAAAEKRPPHRTPSEATRVVPPLADPSLVPGVSRCTSDGVCRVTDAHGTRPGTRLLAVP
jgi:hypothetical protein